LSDVVRRKKEVTGSVTDLIYSALKEKRSKAPLSVGDWIRVSSIGGICPREEVLCSIHDVHRNDVIVGSTGLIFEFGNAVHWLFQNRAIASTGKIIGSWRCTYCGEVYGSRATRMVARPDFCKCGAIAGEAPRSKGMPVLEVKAQAFLYVEEFVGNEEYKIGGRPDGQMTFGDPNNYVYDDLTLLEFKSCNESNFKKYKEAPDFMHVIQAQIYMWLTKLSKGKIIYLNKNGYGDELLKEHDIDVDKEVIDNILSAVTEIREGLLTGTIPERSVCGTPDCNRAFKCPVRKQCFGL
jgi:hypothetical protein